MGHRSRVGIVLVALALLCAPHGWARTETVWNTGYLPDAPVLTHDGRTVPFYEGLVKDRLVVISFIYTKCRDICPVVTARLAQVQEKLGPAFGRDVQFLSISIDPENDKVENLKAYAETFGAGPGWTFITGDAPTMALIRHKLGERSRVLSEHGNTVLLYNDRTGEWSRDSAFSDLNVLAANIRAMNPTALSQREADAGAAANASAGAHHGAGLPGQSLFIKTCAACHTIGRGDRVGPDLAGLAKRRSREWITAYLVSPERLRREGDPIAKALAERYPTVRMPTLSLSTEDAADLIAYLEAMTFAAAQASVSPSKGTSDHGHAGGHHH